MKVNCITTALSDDVLRAVGGSVRWEMDQEKSLTIGKEYLVYGIEFVIDREGYESGTYVLIVPDIGYLVSFRLDYFSISDSRISKYWQIQQPEPTHTYMFPPSFYREDYIDKYSSQDEYILEEIKDVLDDFERVSHLLALEASEHQEEA